MTFTDEQVAEWFKNNPGASETQIAQAMQSSGVDPSQVARVTGADPAYVSQRFDQYVDLVNQATVRPPAPEVGPPSPTNVSAAGSPLTLNNVPSTPAVPSGAPTSQAINATVQRPASTDAYTDAQVLDWFSKNPNATESQIAEAMRVSGVTPTQVARVLNAPVDLVTQRFSEITSRASQPEDLGIAGAPQTSFTEQLNTLFQQNLGRNPTPREASIYAKDFKSTFGPNLEKAFMDRSAQEMSNRQASTQPDISSSQASQTPQPPPTPREVYRPTYTPYRSENQAPFGGYYSLPGISPYGGVFGVGTEQFNQQVNPFAQSGQNARQFLQNRIPSQSNPFMFSLMNSMGMTGVPQYQPQSVGSYTGYNPFTFSPNLYATRMSPNPFSMRSAPVPSAQQSPISLQSNPFVMQQATPTPTTAPTRAGARPGQTVFQGAKTAMRRGGSVDLGIRAVKLRR